MALKFCEFQVLQSIFQILRDSVGRGVFQNLMIGCAENSRLQWLNYI